MPSTFKAEARFRVKTKVPPRSRKFRTIPTPHFWSEKILSFTIVEFEGLAKLGLELNKSNPRSHKLRTIPTPHFWTEKILSFTIVEFEALAKLGLELKQKCPPKPQVLNNSYPTFLERLKIYFFPNRGIREFVVARLQVCRVLIFP